jgi:hypothetical protein
MNIFDHQYAYKLSNVTDYSAIEFGLVCEYNPTSFTYFRLEAGMLSLSHPDKDNAKLFEDKNSRMYIGLSLG